MLFAAIAFAILADVILVLVALGLWSRRRPSDIWQEDVLPSSASRSSIEQRDVGEILKSDVHVPGRGAIHDLSQLSAVWPVAARTSAEY